MKYLKLYESYAKYKKVIKQVEEAQVGDILPEDVIYMYVEFLNDASSIHTHEESFIDGDLGDRIEEHSKYVLENVSIENIDIDEFQIWEDAIEEYVEEYEETKKYPPIVLDSNYRIIDGNHRVNAFEFLGEKEILAFVGI